MKTSRLAWPIAGTIGMVLCVACGSPQLSSDDLIATDVAHAQAVAKSLTATAISSQIAVADTRVPVPTIDTVDAAPTTEQAVAPTPEQAVTPDIPRPTYEDSYPATPTVSQPTDSPTTVPTDPPQPTDTPTDRVAYEDSKPDGNMVPGSTIQDFNGTSIEGVTIEGGIRFADAQGQRDDLVLVKDRLAVQVDAWLNGAGYAKDTNSGIDKVDISIVRVNDDGSEGDVHQRTEMNPPYCSFSDDSNGCTLWVFGDNAGLWPDGTAFENGKYKVSVTIHLKDYEQTQPFWFVSFYLERS